MGKFDKKAFERTLTGRSAKTFRRDWGVLKLARGLSGEVLLSKRMVDRLCIHEHPIAARLGQTVPAEEVQEAYYTTRNFKRLVELHYDKKESITNG